MPEKRSMMAKFDPGHRLCLPNGYWLEKTDDNIWQIGGPMGGTPDVYLAMQVRGNIPVGKGGSMDYTVEELAEGINARSELDEARELLHRWFNTRGEMTGAGTVETLTSEFLKRTARPDDSLDENRNV